jgi:hypothetical protein
VGHLVVELHMNQMTVWRLFVMVLILGLVTACSWVRRSPESHPDFQRLEGLYARTPVRDSTEAVQRAMAAHTAQLIRDNDSLAVKRGFYVAEFSEESKAYIVSLARVKECCVPPGVLRLNLGGSVVMEVRKDGWVRYLREVF